MSARINHVAITSDHYAMNARFYQALFGMTTGKKNTLPPARAISVGDGYVGMTHIPRRDGRTSGLDHFGIEVDDIEDAIARMQKFDSTLRALKRPPIRPYAAYSTHDPDTNIFDLSQRNIGFQKDVYAENSENERDATRTISHIALRTRNAERWRLKRAAGRLKCSGSAFPKESQLRARQISVFVCQVETDGS